MKDRHHLRRVNPPPPPKPIAGMEDIARPSRIDGPKPPSLREGDRTNVLSRRSMLFAAIGQLVDAEPPLVDSDDLRLALLTERVGEVGAVYWRGHADLEGELMKVCATALAWLEAIEKQRAA